MSAFKDLGSYIREQRSTAQISLRQLAAAAGVSNPYLSQIERGLRKPSAEILQQIAKGLRISAEALYVQAGMLDERVGDPDVAAAVVRDSRLSERQKHVLLEIYESFVRESAEAQRVAAQSRLDDEVAAAQTDREPPATSMAKPRTAADVPRADGFDRVRPENGPTGETTADMTAAKTAAKAAPRKKSQPQKARPSKAAKRTAKKSAARPSARAPHQTPAPTPADLKTATHEETA